MTYQERRDDLLDRQPNGSWWEEYAMTLCGELVDENDNLLPAIVKLESSVDGLENENMRLIDELATGNHHYAELTDKVNDLEVELARLRKRDKVVECVLAGAKELKKLGPFDDAVSWLERSLADLDEQKEAGG